MGRKASGAGPICARAEVSAGLGKGAARRDAGGAGHTVGSLSNWKPGARQSPAKRRSGMEPAMTARPRQAGAFRCSDSLRLSLQSPAIQTGPGGTGGHGAGLSKNFLILQFLIYSHRLGLAYEYVTCSQQFLSSLPLSFPPVSLASHTHTYMMNQPRKRKRA